MSSLWRSVGLGVMALLAVAGCDAHTLLTPPASDPNLAIAGSFETWDRVFSNTQINGDIVVPTGKKWLIGANVRISGNVRTDGGTIAMRPGSSLTFVGAKAEQYATGGMRYDGSYSKDWGIWVGGTGVLDIKGTPKVGWNRTGSDPTWNSGDELWISPTAGGDFKPRRWFPGQAIPQADPRVPAAEVINVTRDIVIEGPGHIHISSSKPQTIEYVTLRRMGISNANLEATTGRYALHFHFQGDGSRGTVVRGVAAIQSEGRVYVPHESHGIEFIDNVSVNSYAEAFWWDVGDRTSDVLVDRLAVSGVQMPREVTGSTSRHDGVTLGGGDRMTIRNSVVSGVSGGGGPTSGFDWPSGADNNGRAVWTFEDNVAHNNINGMRLWFNNRDPHEMRRFVTYRNKEWGIQNGAYSNAQRWFDGVLFEDKVIQHGSSKPRIDDGLPARFENLDVFAKKGPALVIGLMVSAAQDRMEFVNCRLISGSGDKKVGFQTGDGGLRNPFIALFRNCGVTPADFAWPSPMPSTMNGSSVIIEHEDGRRWEITVKSGKVATRLF